MATYTEYLNLKKPEQIDQYNVDDFNGNCDILDNSIKNLDNVVSHVTFEIWQNDKTYAQNKCVSKIVSGEVKLYKSLQNNNTGNDPETATTYWEEISLGGGTIAVTYADNTTADLEAVVYQTTSTYVGRTTFPNNQIDVVEDIGDNYNPLYFANTKTISANTNYTYQQNGTFCTSSSSVATVTITDTNSNSVTVYGNIVRIPRGCTFTSSVAGKFFFDDNYYGYLAS